MAKGRVQRIQDSVHGLMEFHGVEGVVVDLLRTPELQRLRRIRQLGLANYVFPGAEHSRLVHCLGAAHLAIRFARRLHEVAHEIFAPSLCPDEMATRDIAIAALCHDLGHGPFSHAWEREIIGESFNRDSWVKKLGLPDGDWWHGLKWHELVGHGLLCWPDGKLYRLLEQHEESSADRIHKLLLGRYYVPYLPRLLVSDLDVDRADFIKRDTIMTGVGYGRYDLEWLISTCTIGEVRHPTTNEWVVGFDIRKAIRVVEQFLIARRALYETVYWHKTVRCAEGMMALFLRRLRTVVLDGTKVSDDRYFKPLIDVINGKPLEQHELLSLDDNVIQFVVETVAHSDLKDVTVKDLARRIAERDLFKVVPLREDSLTTFLADTHWREKLCAAIQPFVAGEAEFYFIMDSRQFRMMSKNASERINFVNTVTREAEPASDSAAFAEYRNYSVSSHSLFTIREAIPAVKNLIEPRHN